MRSRTAIGLAITFLVGVVTGALVLQDSAAPSLLSNAVAQQATDRAARISPTKALPKRDLYFPGTEDLDPNETRITALGTGMPSARPKQAAACFLVELGNGDKFLFDIGSQCQSSFSRGASLVRKS